MSLLPLLEEACEALPHTRRAMFGGHGFFAPTGGMFAAIVDDGIALKFADETTRAELESSGGHAWKYAEKMTMKEWILVPERFYDEPQTLAEWARRAHRLVPPKKAKPAAKAKGRPPAKTPKKSSTKKARRR